MDGSGVGYGKKALPTEWYLHSGWDHSGHPHPLLAPSLPMVQAQIPQPLSRPTSPLSFSPAPIPLGATQGGGRGHLGFSELDKLLWAPPCSPVAMKSECSAGLCKGEGCPEDHRAGLGLKGRVPCQLLRTPPTSDARDPDKDQSTRPVPPSFALRVCNLSCQRGTCPGRTSFEKNNFFYCATAARLRPFQPSADCGSCWGGHPLLARGPSFAPSQFTVLERLGQTQCISWLEGATEDRVWGCLSVLTPGSLASALTCGIGFCCFKSQTRGLRVRDVVDFDGLFGAFASTVFGINLP